MQHTKQNQYFRQQSVVLRSSTSTSHQASRHTYLCTTWSCHCNDMYLRKALKQLIVPHKAGKQAELTPTTACLLARMACMHGWRACLWAPSHGSSLCAWSACVPVGPLTCPLHSRVSCSCACGPLTCPKACAHGLQLRLLSLLCMRAPHTPLTKHPASATGVL